MVHNRIPVESPADPAILGQQLHFKTSGLRAKNRFLKAAMSEQIATYEPGNLPLSGVPTQRLINLYEKTGHGGWGVIITGNVVVDHRHMEGPGNILISKETESEQRKFQLRRLTSAAKAQGSLVVAQLSHGGRQTLATMNPHPFAASETQLGIEMKGSAFGKPVALTTEQVRTEVVDRFVYSAIFAYESGFDGVELHAGNGYLLSNFLSPSTNHRDDQYGGSVQNRIRVIEEIYNGIRDRIPAGNGFAIGIKMNSAEFQDGGLNEDDVITMAKAFDNLGFDFLELTGGTFEKLQFGHVKESTKVREAFFVEFAAVIRPHIRNAVVYLTGGFRTVPAMVQAIRDGVTDGIAMARPAAAELDLPHKMLEKGIQGAANSVFEADFGLSLPAAGTQLAQAASSDLHEAGGDPTFGVSDFSNEEESEAYKAAMFPWFTKLCEQGKKGRAEVGVFEYHTRSKQVNDCPKTLVQRILRAL